MNKSNLYPLCLKYVGAHFYSFMDALRFYDHLCSKVPELILRVSNFRAAEEVNRPVSDFKEVVFPDILNIYLTANYVDDDVIQLTFVTTDGSEKCDGLFKLKMEYMFLIPFEECPQFLFDPFYDTVVKFVKPKLDLKGRATREKVKKAVEIFLNNTDRWSQK